MSSTKNKYFSNYLTALNSKLNPKQDMTQRQEKNADISPVLLGQSNSQTQQQRRQKQKHSRPQMSSDLPASSSKRHTSWGGLEYAHQVATTTTRFNQNSLKTEERIDLVDMRQDLESGQQEITVNDYIDIGITAGVKKKKVMINFASNAKLAQNMNDLELSEATNMTRNERGFQESASDFVMDLKQKIHHRNSSDNQAAGGSKVSWKITNSVLKTQRDSSLAALQSAKTFYNQSFLSNGPSVLTMKASGNSPQQQQSREVMLARRLTKGKDSHHTNNHIGTSEKRRRISLLLGTNSDLINARVEQKKLEMQTSQLSPQQPKDNIESLIKESQRDFKQMVKEMNGGPLKRVVDPKVIEEWLNQTLREAELMKEIPDQIALTEAKIPLVRFGIDRITLTNAGIPNEQVSRLYQSLFVHSLGYLNFLKEFGSYVKEVNLKTSLKHQSRENIVSAVWKVFQVLVEEANSTDYKFLIVKYTENLRNTVAVQEEELLRLRKEVYNFDVRLEQQKLGFSKTVEEFEYQIKDESLKRARAEEELLWNIKSHEDEVKLRIQFEDKLNLLHQMHLENQRQKEKSKQEYEQLAYLHEEVIKKNAFVAQESLDIKLEKADLEAQIERLERQYERAEMESLRKGKAQQAAETRMIIEVQKAEKIQTEFGKIEKDKEYEQEKLKRVKDQLRHLQGSHDQYMREAEDLQVRGVNLNKRILELTAENEYYLETLNELKGKYHHFEQEKFNKQTFLEGIRQEKDEMDKRIVVKEKEISDLHVKIKVLEIDISNLRLDKTNYQQQIIELNKNREEIRSLAEDRARQIKAHLEKIEDLEQHNLNYVEQMNQTDKRYVEIHRKLEEYDMERKAGRLDFENSRRLLSERIGALDGQLCDEMDAKKMWQEKFQNESRSLSKANLEIIELKTKLQEKEFQMYNLEMELTSMRAINQGLGLSKSELQDTVNRYIAKSESLEAEIFAINEVAKDVERQKALDNRHFNHKINQLKGILNCFEMQTEEFLTRLYNSEHQNHRLKQTLFKFALIQGFVLMLTPSFKAAIKEHMDRHNQIYSDKCEELDTLQNKQYALDQEIQSSRAAYTYMKAKLDTHDEEVNRLQSQLTLATKNVMRLEEINGRLFSEVTGYRERRGAVFNKVTQTYPNRSEAGVQCTMISANTNGTANASQRFINTAQKAYKQSQEHLSPGNEELERHHGDNSQYKSVSQSPKRYPQIIPEEYEGDNQKFNRVDSESPLNQLMPILDYGQQMSSSVPVQQQNEMEHQSITGSHHTKSAVFSIKKISTSGKNTLEYPSISHTPSVGQLQIPITDNSNKNRIMASMSNLAAPEGSIMSAINIQNNKIPEVKIVNAQGSSVISQQVKTEQARKIRSLIRTAFHDR